jgi:hypothetical protein
MNNRMAALITLSPIWVVSPRTSNWASHGDDEVHHTHTHDVEAEQDLEDQSKPFAYASFRVGS